MGKLDREQKNENKIKNGIMLTRNLLYPDITCPYECVSKSRQRRCGFCRSGQGREGVGRMCCTPTAPTSGKTLLSKGELLSIYIRKNTKRIIVKKSNEITFVYHMLCMLYVLWTISNEYNNHPKGQWTSDSHQCKTPSVLNIV